MSFSFHFSVLIQNTKDMSYHQSSAQETPKHSEFGVHKILNRHRVLSNIFFKALCFSYFIDFFFLHLTWKLIINYRTRKRRSKNNLHRFRISEWGFTPFEMLRKKKYFSPA